MNTTWTKTSWGKLTTLEYGKRLKNYQNNKGKYPVYGSAGQIGTSNTFCVNEGVIISRKGTLDVYYSKTPFNVIDTAFWLNPDPSLNSRWAYYALKNFDIKNLTSGSAVPSISRDDLYAQELYLPTNINEQKAIAYILGTFDDKIELNQKMNQTLEEITKTLFKSWFIDFDPVRAKAEGKPTKLLKEINDLFPNSFEDSEPSKIPTGWKFQIFNDFVKPKRGKTITKTKSVSGDVPVVAGGLTPAYFHNKSNVTAPTVTISASGANAGYVNLYFSNIWASDCSYISKNETDFIYTSYIFLKLNQQKIFDLQHGGVQPHINPNDLMNLKIPLLPEQLLKQFEDIVEPLFKKISINKSEIKTLEKTRDILLQKLISGELRVPYAEKMLEEVGI